MKIRVFAVCYNEEVILPYFLQHYLPWVDEIVIADGGSTDNSIKIMSKMSQGKVWLKPMTESGLLDDEYLTELRNTGWIDERTEEFDWQIVCDMDELLYHPNIVEKLKEFKEAGVTLPVITGFEMIGNSPLDPTKPLVKQIPTGRKDEQWLGKNLIFNPQQVRPKFHIGCHQSFPTGNVVRNKDPLYLLHYRKLNYTTFIKKSKASAQRLSEKNRLNNWGTHYATLADTSVEKYNQEFMESTNVIEEINNNNIKKAPDRSYLRAQEGFVYSEMFEWNVYQIYEVDMKDRYVLDIGGHYGMFTTRAIDLGAKQVIAVEANPINFINFLKNTKDFPNVKAINAAVSHTTGQTVSIENHGGGSRVGRGTNMVSTVSLVDVVSWFPDNANILMKMDIEGAEFDILYNTPAETIRRFGTIVIEIHGPKHAGGNPKYTVADLKNYIMNLGYTCMWEGAYFTDFDDGSRLHQEDVVVCNFARV